MYFCALGKFFLFSSQNSIRSTNIALVHNDLVYVDVLMQHTPCYAQLHET